MRGGKVCKSGGESGAEEVDEECDNVIEERWWRKYHSGVSSNEIVVVEDG